jgi:hypothetical protein
LVTKPEIVVGGLYFVSGITIGGYILGSLDSPGGEACNNRRVAWGVIVMKVKLLGFVACMILPAMSPAMAATTNYYLDYTAGSLTVMGSITTDGNTGPLLSTDITGWNLTFTGDGAPITVSTAPGGLLFLGNDLSATTTALLFNFGDSASGTVEFTTPSGLPQASLTYETSGANGGGPGVIELGESQSQDNTSEANIFPGTNDVIGTTPLPATLPLFAGGLGFVGYLTKRRKQNNKQALAVA